MSTRERFETDRDKILDGLPDDTDNIDLDEVDVTSRLRLLRDLQLVEYVGHGEFEITRTQLPARNLFEDTAEWTVKLYEHSTSHAGMG